MCDTRTLYAVDPDAQSPNSYMAFRKLVHGGDLVPVVAKWYCDNTFVVACTPDDPHGSYDDGNVYCHWAVEA